VNKISAGTTKLKVFGKCARKYFRMREMGKEGREDKLQTKRLTICTVRLVLLLNSMEQSPY
jgi:hypothetical protein